MVPDYHVHTPFCKHAQGDLAAYVDRACHLGMKEMAFTDHAPAPDGYDPTNRMDITTFQNYLVAIRSAAEARPKLRILLGIEADYYPGCDRFLASWLTDQPFDFVIGSVHYLGEWGFDNAAYRTVWETVDVTAAWAQYFRQVAAMARLGLYDVIGHLDLPKKFGFRPPPKDLLEMAGPALDAVAAAQMAVEVNTSGLRRPCAEVYPSLDLLRMCRDREIPICFGSDAHQPEEVGYAFHQAVDLARTAGYRHRVVLCRRRKQYVPLI